MCIYTESVNGKQRKEIGGSLCECYRTPLVNLDLLKTKDTIRYVGTVRYAPIFARKYGTLVRYAFLSRYGHGTLVRYAFLVMVRVRYAGTVFEFVC